VHAVIYLFDAEDKFFASGRAALESAVLSAGGMSAFDVRVPATMPVTRYRVSFQHESGAAVAHVDRRGAVPEGATDIAIEPEPTPTPTPTSPPAPPSRRRR
jgi:hypothetical protein